MADRAMIKTSIRSHDLDESNASGNGHHGNCRHCGLPLVTDLGYCSWDGVECIDRPLKISDEEAALIREYARFNGLRWQSSENVFVKPYSDQKPMTMEDIVNKINSLIP